MQDIRIIFGNGGGKKPFNPIPWVIAIILIVVGLIYFSTEFYTTSLDGGLIANVKALFTGELLH